MVITDIIKERIKSKEEEVTEKQKFNYLMVKNPKEINRLVFEGNDRY